MGEIKNIHRNALQHIEDGLLNGGVYYFQDGTAYSAFCTIGDEYVEDGKLWTTSNMYEIQFYNHSNGVTIYKSNNISLHYKCFYIGETVELFGKNCLFKGCRVFEDLEMDEILTKLVNRDFRTYNNVSHNKYNLLFINKMQERLIKVLLYHKLIYWSDNLKKYVDMKYKEYGM